MFISFFPGGKRLFAAAAAWSVLAVALWYAIVRSLGQHLGVVPPPGTPPIVGISAFWSPGYLWFYGYFLSAVVLFGAAVRIFSSHPWQGWSVWGSALLLFVTYFQVQVAVVINAWYGPFYNLIQTALSRSHPVKLTDFFHDILIFIEIASVAVVVGAFTQFFASHYVFRWRTAMNGFYLRHWQQLREVEGASQRVQDDTMRFSRTTETLGVALIQAIMTLIAFLPVLIKLTKSITHVPILGGVPHPIVVAAVLWSAFGTAFLALIGIRLPGLEFNIQKVEASYRKELVYGEDDADRASPPSLSRLFDDVRRNYFRLYGNYLVFNVGRILYLQTDNIFPYLILGPTIVAGAITLGLMQQILAALDNVRQSFQYLVNSWPTIVELLSIRKRLHAFERTIAQPDLLPAGPPAWLDDRQRR